MADESPSVLRWRPIEDLPADHGRLASRQLAELRRAWRRQRTELRESDAVRDFVARQVRQWSIQTGIIERLYTLDEGITLTLVEQGFDAAYIPHGASDMPAEQLVRVLRDHQTAAEGLFAFVKQTRPLTTSYVKELHAVLCRSQAESDAVDSLLRPVRVPLVRGAYKTQPNNPRDRDTLRVVFEYCPPEHVDAEMERLVQMHGQHGDVAAEVEAAWLHHRFVQIHPFQDGNGRVARALATLVCLRDGGFPLVVMANEKAAYIEALRAADRGDLQPLVQLVTDQQIAAFQQALTVGQEVLVSAGSIEAVLADARRRIEEANGKQRLTVHDVAVSLHATTHSLCTRIASGIRSSMAGLANPPTLIVRGFEPASPELFRSVFGSMLASQAHALGHQPNLTAELWSTELRVDYAPGLMMVIFIYHVGPRDVGLMAAAVTGLAMEGIGLPSKQPAQLVSQKPWFFTADTPQPELVADFTRWLEAALTRGIDLWRRQL